MDGEKPKNAAESQGVSDEGNAPVKTAAQLKKEAARQAKLEKFKKKQEQQAALKEAQAEVGRDTVVCVFQARRPLCIH